MDPTNGDDVFTGDDTNNTFDGLKGDDTLDGGGGDDILTGGRDNDIVNGGAGNDTANYFLGDGVDQTDLGDGDDTVLVGRNSGGDIRLTFTSADVGNGAALDGANAVVTGGGASEDGGLAVRLQAETTADVLTGVVTRFDDEGVTFRASTPGLQFDVRDLPSAAARGSFNVVELGTAAADTLTGDAGLTNYINAGGGDDTVTGAELRDFLVGGAGADRLNGGEGDDTLFGGGGNDDLRGDAGSDILFGGAGADQLRSGAADGVRDTFRYDFLTESDAIVSANRDRISDFEVGVDKIDLSRLFLNETQVQITSANGDTLVRVDSDLDGAFDDFGILVKDVTTLTVADFIGLAPGPVPAAPAEFVL